MCRRGRDRSSKSYLMFHAVLVTRLSERLRRIAVIDNPARAHSRVSFVPVFQRRVDRPWARHRLRSQKPLSATRAKQTLTLTLRRYSLSMPPRRLRLQRDEQRVRMMRLFTNRQNRSRVLRLLLSSREDPPKR